MCCEILFLTIKPVFLFVRTILDPKEWNCSLGILGASCSTVDQADKMTIIATLTSDRHAGCMRVKLVGARQALEPLCFV